MMHHDQINDFLNGKLILEVLPEHCDEVVQMCQELNCSIAGEYILKSMKTKYPRLYFASISDHGQIIAFASFAEAKPMAKHGSIAVLIKYNDNINAEIDDTFLDLI